MAQAPQIEDEEARRDDISEERLETVIEARDYQWPEDVHKAEELVEKFEEADTMHDYSMIVSSHLKKGNHKISDNTVIWNFASATDCENIGTERCQVPVEFCYAHRDEYTYSISKDDNSGPISYRRRQEYIWDSLDPETFAECIIRATDRMSNDIQFLRINESGDLRNNGDIVRLNEVAKILKEERDIVTYLYTASYHLNWEAFPEVEFTVNASNDIMMQHEAADHRFGVVNDDRSSDAVVCPFEASDQKVKCGECLRCIKPRDEETAITMH